MTDASPASGLATALMPSIVTEVTDHDPMLIHYRKPPDHRYIGAHTLNPLEHTVVGRSKRAHITLEEDPTISGRHLRFSAILDERGLVRPGHFHVTDTGSSHGTMLIRATGERVELRADIPHPMGHGDRLELGSSILQFISNAMELAYHAKLSAMGQKKGYDFECLIQEAFEQYARPDVPIVTWGLDHLKAINDRFGHGPGDRAIEWAGRLGAAVLRESGGGVLGHAGGGRFVAALPEGVDPRVVEQRLVRALGTTVFAVEGHRLIPTTYVGWIHEPGAKQTSRVVGELCRRFPPYTWRDTTPGYLSWREVL